MTGVVRSATAADLPAIDALQHAAIDLGEYPAATDAELGRNMAALAAEPETVLVTVDGGAVVGYLAAQQNDLYVEAARRRQGHGTALVEAALPFVRDQLRFPCLLLYVPPGDTPGRGFALARGFTFRATLYWMERPANDPCPAPDFPPGFVTRAWDPARDEIPNLVGLLNACFADHPTPVAWTEAAVRAAHEAPEFDPGDILLVATAHDPERAVAFCRARFYRDDERPFGEVKLVGVLPAWRGRGLGRALLRWGVRHLQDGVNPTTALAVQAANVRAVRMYEAHGFRPVTEWPQWGRDA